MSEAPDTLLQPDPVCPYCGEKVSDAWELDDDTEIECGACEREFWCWRVVDVRYTTGPAKEYKP